MKHFLFVLITIFSLDVCHADTVNIDWIVDGTTYDSTTCNMGGDLEIPTTNPTKPGYTFRGWKIKGYTPVEFLKASGSQYIDTGYKLDDNIKVIFKANWTTVAQYLFGAATNSGSTCLMRSTIELLGSWKSINGISKNTDYVIEIQIYPGNGYAKINNTSVISTNNTTTNSEHMYIFLATSGSSRYYQEMKLYYFQIYQNDVLVRDMIPVLDSDDVACMFDKVSNTFFYNAGTANFIAGPVVGE